MTDNERRECREIAAAIVKEVLQLHIAACPHGRELDILRAKIVGVAAGCSILGASTLFGLAKLFGI